MAKQYWKANVWSAAKTKIRGEYGIWQDEAGIQKYATKMLTQFPGAAYACWESQLNPSLTGCVGAIPFQLHQQSPGLKIEMQRRPSRGAAYAPPTVAGVGGCGCSSVGETETGGKALGWAVFVGIAALAAGFIWIGTRGD